MSRKLSSDTGAEDLIKAFQVFDKDNSGHVNITELRYILTALGDRLDDDIVDSMLNTADPSGCGSITYEPFIRSMLRNG